MAISNELNTLKANISRAYTMIQNKGGTIPTNKNTQNLSSAISTIQGGGSGTDYFVDNIPSNNYKAIKLIKNIPPITVGNNVTSLQELFSNCSSLNTISLLDTSKVTNMVGMFKTCTSLTTVPLLDTSKVTNMQEMFYSCSALTTVPLLDTSSITNIWRTFNSCGNIENIGGFQNLGNAYSKTASAANYYYELNLTAAKKLTHDSLMNVINNLYDIKTKGCKAQKLTLGTDNKAKLTAEEIAIATNKGWTVS